MSDFTPYFGWIPPKERTPRQWTAHFESRQKMPKFSIIGRTNEEPCKVDLTDLWSHTDTVSALGYAYPGVRQSSGCCVGAGGGNAIFTLAAIEVIRVRDPEQILIPFWLLPYGRSRFYAGMTSPGDGSLGSTFARAAKEDGVVEAKREGLPGFDNQDGLSWGERVEVSWSDGDAAQTIKLLPDSRKHLIQTVSSLQRVDDVEQSIRNLYPVTIACSLIPAPKIVEEGFAFGRVARGGGHQTTLLGVQSHPKYGLVFKYVNQWGLRWGYNGTCWIPASDVTSMIRDGEECYAFSQYQGFPAQTFSLFL